MSFSQFCLQNSIDLKKDEIMKKHTSFKIGGKADYFVSPANVTQLKAVIEELKSCEIPYFIIGKGSNLLVSDNGIEGAVISLAGFDEMSVSDNIVTVEAGATLARLCTFARDNSLSGLEFAYGIPGSVGGALYMNAGAYGGETKDVVKSVLVLDKDGKISDISKDDCGFDYRKSIFQNDEYVILGAVFELCKSNADECVKQAKEIMQKRIDKQPLEYPSCGSTFKRPEGYFAGALIEEAGLKGFSIGGAQVSEKHAGFVINKDNATTNDVLKLMRYIREKIKEQKGVTLEEEIKLLDKNGEFFKL